jgi:hypothetical protein
VLVVVARIRFMFEAARGGWLAVAATAGAWVSVGAAAGVCVAAGVCGGAGVAAGVQAARVSTSITITANLKEALNIYSSSMDL